MIRPVATVLAAVAFATPAAADGQATIEGVRISRVIDGDTVTVPIRLLDLDAPELGGRARCPAEAELAERARARLESLLDGPVVLTIEGRDRYGRLLGRLGLPDGRTVAETLIEEGLARPWTGGGDPERWCAGSD